MLQRRGAHSPRLSFPNLLAPPTHVITPSHPSILPAVPHSYGQDPSILPVHFLGLVRPPPPLVPLATPRSGFPILARSDLHGRDRRPGPLTPPPGTDMTGDEDTALAAGATARRPYWRSQSWSASRSADPPAEAIPGRRLPVPLTPRSQQNCKARSCLPPLQPLAIARRSVDEWPTAGSDDVGEWAPPLTPGRARGDLKLGGLPSLRGQMAFFDKECSKVAEHIYLGGDAVARDRDILRRHGITHVLNCVGFVCPEYFKSDLVYRTLWLQDSPSEDITSILYDVFDYFEDVREQRGRLLVHCCQGVSRSTSLVIAYLMWREGQSFEDAFEFVKAARGIANPNMGFACQLLQCQKRVHAIPLSPSSLLRMYRMAPHSPYDALHLVPKMLGEPLPSVLDSRGAFIVHVPSSIYVWIGRKCEPVMEKDAKAAAHQVIRYEKVPGPIVIVEEGAEPLDFWEAFSGAAVIPDTDLKMRKGTTDPFADTNSCAGKRKVDAYDSDFELFHKGLRGGVLPAGADRETHIPARESDWSVLRWKFVPGGIVSKAMISRVYSDSLLSKDADTRLSRVRPMATDPSLPLKLSPISLSSDSSNSSKCSIDSPEVSPSAEPSVVLVPPTLGSLSDAVPTPQLPHKSQTCPEPAKFSLKAILSPSKRFGRSLAERRGGFSPSLKLSTSANEPSQSCQQSLNASSEAYSSLQDHMLAGIGNRSLDNGILDKPKLFKRAPVVNSLCNSLDRCPDSAKRPDSKESMCFQQSNNSSFPMAYTWPDSKKIDPFSRDDLNSQAAFLILVHDTTFSFTSNLKSYLWIGSLCVPTSGSLGENVNSDRRNVKHVDWNQVGRDILKSVSLPSDIPMKVIWEEESDDFLDSIFNKSQKK